MKKTLTKLIFLFATLLLSQLTFAQASLVKGQVVDKEGNPLPGVSVLQLGSTNGTITSIDGKYAISNLNENDSLRFSYVGFNNQVIKVGKQTIINVVMLVS